jgi:predicted nuclease of predicted toxin-antitoxin system
MRSSSAAARERGPGTVVLTKDGDFHLVLARHGPPPQVVWLRCGNTTNAYLRQLFATRWPEVQRLADAGEPPIEIR